MQAALPPPTEAHTTFLAAGEQGSAGNQSMPEIYKAKVERTWDDPSSLLFPAVLTLLENDSSFTAKERLGVYVIIPLEERPEILVFVK